ncbi:hypothetical protein M9H77_32072 [Catharanthus roseus]|uniref:Uncharacterized protein n=1 Tax=Catharanthus roseus TaxID=4058 RepID=A0ACC0A309_CATRO|nr:hypothetical protein M9H77_32072 [Catharanthus roseus]
MKYAYRRSCVPILCDTEKLGILNWSKYVIDFLENRINLRNTGDWASVSGCMLLLATVINKRVQMLREFGLFSGVDVDMVDALGPRKDTVELEALRSRHDSFSADLIEVKVELKSLWESINKIRNVELSQSNMMEELHWFMTFINEKYREGGVIQMDCE